MKRFTLYRPNVPDTHTADQKAPADQPQLEGVIFSDGTTVLRWCTTPSTSVWSSFEDMEKIHGHPEYGTYFVWHDDDQADLLAALKALQLQALQSPDLLSTEWGQEALALTQAAIAKAEGK